MWNKWRKVIQKYFEKPGGQAAGRSVEEINSHDYLFIGDVALEDSPEMRKLLRIE